MYLPKVNLLFSLGRYAEAEPVLREALVQNPNDPTAHAMLAVALSRLGRSKEALRESQTAVGLGPTEPYVFYAQSLVYIRTGRPALALHAVGEALRLDSTNPEYFLIQGALLYDRKQWNRALTALNQALAISPRHVRSLNLRARTLVQLGRREEADQTMKSALAAGPENADAHHARGVLLLTQAQTDEALDHLLEARRLNPVERNDSASIAMAVGWQLIPFRWINRRAVHWNLWPAKVQSALFVGLMLILIALTIYAPGTIGRRDLPQRFGIVVANLLVAPFTLDALAAALAQTVRRRLVGSTWRKLARQTIRLVKFVFLQSLATGVGRVPEMLLPVLSIAACSEFLTHFARRGSDQVRWCDAPWVLYSLGLISLSIFLVVQFAVQPVTCLPTIGVFALMSLFSDNFLRWAQRWQP